MSQFDQLDTKNNKNCFLMFGQQQTNISDDATYEDAFS